MTNSTAPVIWINGYPGVGKFTIAKALHHLICNSILIDNHQLIDPVENMHPRGSRLYNEKRAEYRRKVLSPIAHDPSTKDTIYIFTDCQIEYNECVGDYTDLALSCNGNGARQFYSVVLECEYDENARRLTAPARGGEGSTKLKEPKVLSEIRERYSPWKFEDENEFVLDVTAVEVKEAAAKIKSFFDKRQREGKAMSGMDEV